MTEEEFEARVRRDLGAIADAVPEPAAAALLLSAPPWRRGRWLVAAAAGLLLLVGGLVWAANGGDGETGPADTTDPPSTSAPVVTTTAPTTTLAPTTSLGPEEVAPPPSGTGAHQIWLSTEVVSTDGTDVVFAVVGEPTSGSPFGVAFAVDRWDGEGWTPHTRGASCVDFWRCWGAVAAPGEPEVVLSLGFGLGVGYRGVGRAEYVHIDGLETGWYRITKQVGGETAAGVFRVVAADELPPLTPSPQFAADEFSLVVRPVVAPTTGGRMTVELVGPPPVPDWVLVDGVVERWTGGEWVGVFSLDGLDSDSSFLLPALEPGSYRVSSTDGELVDGQFWVTDEIPRGIECRALPDLAALLGAEADAFDGPAPPTSEMRPSFAAGGIRAEWSSDEATIVYSSPRGIADLVGERAASGGPLLLWYRGGGATGDPSRVEVWVTLPPCGEEQPSDPATFESVSFSVSGGSEEANVSLAVLLGWQFARFYGSDYERPVRSDCPGPDSPDPVTPNAVHVVWMYCSTSADAESALVPVKTVFSPDDPVTEVIRRALGSPWNGFESGIPLQLRGSLKTIEIIDGVLTIDWGWDFSKYGVNNLGTSNVTARMADQIEATAFQFDEIDAIDWRPLPFEREDIYTREEWESRPDR